jgi:tetratricopeptide (TPR) repeat protein
LKVKPPRMKSRPDPRTGREPFRFLKTVRTTAAAAAAVACLGLGGCATAPAGAPEVRLDFPSPDSGPGRPALDKPERRHIDDGWRALRRGDAAAARASATQAGVTPASRLLELQAAVVAGDHSTRGLEALTGTDPDYAAAWLTLAVAAESDANEGLALRAAARGADLWPDARWVTRYQDLRQRWIGDRIISATTLYEQGDPGAALDALEPALALDPRDRDALLVQTRALIALNQLDRAESVLAGLPRDRDVVLIAGSIAEARGDSSAAIRIYSSLQDDPDAILMAVALAEQQGDWQTAMDLYSSLPDDRPEKAPGLRAAKLRWRVSVMPPYVRDALSTTDMNRSDLAVALVTLTPAVETMPGGQVPLLSDIVDMPSQQEIITATRLGLIDVDRLERRFYPLRPVTEQEVRTSISRLCKLLGIAPPTWCGGDHVENCLSFNQPIAGNQVAEVLIGLAAEEAK